MAIRFSGVKAYYDDDQWCCFVLQYLGYCRNSYSTTYKINGYTELGVTSNHVNNMMAAIANNGPVEAALCASTFGAYGSGIMRKSDCCTDLNHGITIVGYGTEGGIPYWIIKNRFAFTSV